MTQDGPPTRQPYPRLVNDEPPYDPAYDGPPPATHRPPPQNDAAERAVLGALMHRPDLADQLAHELTASDFYRPAHETIWNALHHLADQLHGPTGNDPTQQGQQLAADFLLLSNYLEHTGELARVGGATYLHDLQAGVPVVANVHYYAEIVRNKARARAVVELGTRLVDTGHRAADPHQLDTALGDAVDLVDQAATRFGPTITGPSAWAALDLTLVLEGKEFDPPPALLQRSDGAHMLYEGAVHTFSGEPGSGKTWALLVAAVQQLADNHIVTMIDFEDRASRVVARLLALGATPTQVRNHFRYVRPRTALDTTTRHDLDHATRGASLVILDGVTEAMTLHGLDLNANADVATFYDLLPRHIADTCGAAVTLIDHVVKDGEKQGRWGLGGQHKLAGIDGVAYLVKAIDTFGRGKTGRARITVAKDRPGYVEEIALGRTVAELLLDATDVNVLRYSLDPPAAVARDDAGNMRPTHLMERVSRYIEITPGLGKNELLDGRISGKKEYLRRAFDRLLQEGYLEVATGSNRKQIHRIVTPYREDEDAMHTTSGWADQEHLS